MIREGFVAAEVRAEHPGLVLHWRRAPARAGPSPPELAARLRALSGRVRGADVVAMRLRPIPYAYRVFFRQAGLDPDVVRVPAEAAAVARLRQGGLRSRGWLADAQLVALVETGVPVWALDAGVVGEGGPGIGVEADDLAICGPGVIHAPLFGEPLPGHGVSAASREAILYAVGVAGVPRLHVEEALWTCADLLE